MVLRVGPFKQFFSIEKCCLPISEVLNNNKTEQNKTNPSRKKKKPVWLCETNKQTYRSIVYFCLNFKIKMSTLFC